MTVADRVRLQLRGDRAGSARAGGRKIRRSRPLAALSLLAIVAAGCGGGDERPTGIAFERGLAIEAGTSRAAVAGRLGEEPLLTSSPTREAPGGCDYYAMRDQPLANVWEVCFDERDEVAEVEVQFAPADQAAPPEDASPARAALLGRGDSICAEANRALDRITEDVDRALRRFSSRQTSAGRELVGDAIRRFIGNLEGTHARLGVFDPPSDERDALTAYLGSLESQVDVLERARTALLAEDDEAYDRLGDEFSQLGEAAEERASEYGFATCAAPTFR